MRIVVLTSRRRGFASVALEKLVQKDSLELAGVIYNEGQRPSRVRVAKRHFRKARRIGLLGALNGLRMRSWFGEDARQWVDVEPIEEIAERLSVPFHRTDRIGSKTTVEIFERLGPDLGLSLGNGYIPRRVFTVPKHGMVNVHHEVLPEFRGALSVLWQIHEGSTDTGYSIHQIDEHIDTGRILYRETIPIKFKDSLRETTSYNYARLWRESAKQLPEVILNYVELDATAQPQGPGRSFTTPTIWQYLRMERQHRRLRRENASTVQSRSFGSRRESGTGMHGP